MGDVVMKDKLRSGLPSLICVLDESITDLIIVCKDGAVCGHQVIIAWASTSVRQWLLSRLLVEKGGNRKEQVTIFLPDVGTAAVSALTTFLLTGQMDIRASKQFGKELEDAWHLLGIDRISFHEVTFGGKTGSVEERENSQHRITAAPPGPKIVSGKSNVNLSPSIPQNLLHNSNLSITRENGERVQDKKDKVIIDITDREPNVKTKASERTYVGNATTTSNGFFNRARLSHKFQVKTNYVDKKVEELSPIQESVNSSVVRKSLRTRTVTGSYNEEELEKRGVRSVGETSKTVDNTAFGLSTLIDDEQAERIKENILRGKCPKLKVSIKKLSTGHGFLELNNSNIDNNLPPNNSILSPFTTLSPISPSISISKTPINETLVRKTNMKISTAQKTLDDLSQRQVKIPSFSKSVTSLQSQSSIQSLPPNTKSYSMEGQSLLINTQFLPQSVSITKVCKGVKEVDMEPSGKSKPTEIDATPRNPKVMGRPGTKILLATSGTFDGARISGTPGTVRIPETPRRGSVSGAGRTAKMPETPVTLNSPESNFSKSLSAASESKRISGPERVARITGQLGKIGSMSSETTGTQNTPETERILEISAEAVTKITKSKIRKSSGLNLVSEPPEKVLTSVPLSPSKVLNDNRTRKEKRTDDGKLLTCYICKNTEDEDGRKLNQRNLFFVRSHLSKCLYKAGKLFQAIPPGKKNTDTNGLPIDEMGTRTNSWYNCQVEGCWLAQKKGVSGQVCYKVFAIHMASQHGALEMVMLEEGGQASELVERLFNTEQKKVVDTELSQENLLNPVVDNKSDVSLEEGVNVETVYNPIFQEPVQFTSEVYPSDSSVKSPNVLHETISGSDSSLAVTSVSRSLKNPSVKTKELLRCRFANCPSGQSPVTPTEMKLHYAGRHFSHLFTLDPETKFPPGFTRSGSRAVCCKCTELSGKPVYIQGDEHIVRGHLVVKHDSLGEVLLHTTESPEARAVISDLYPDWKACT